MAPVSLELGWTPTEPSCESGSWTWESRSCLEEALPAIEFVASAMAREGYPELDIFEMRQALHEAIRQAVEEANAGDPDKLVRVHCQVDPDRALVEVEDEGTVAESAHCLRSDPAPHWLESCLTWARPEARGNWVTVCKYRSDL
jgi:hypothetical protein